MIATLTWLTYADLFSLKGEPKLKIEENWKVIVTFVNGLPTLS